MSDETGAGNVVDGRRLDANLRGRRRGLSRRRRTSTARRLERG